MSIENSKKLLAIGGGTGAPGIIRSLQIAGAKEADAVAAMFDNGGYTLKRRLDSQGEEAAYSDALRMYRELIAITQDQDPKAEVIRRWLTYKNGKGEVPGYGLAHNWFDKEEGFRQLHEDIETLGIRLIGKVLPASTYPSHIHFQTESPDGHKEWHEGENKLDEMESSDHVVINMVLSPEVPAYGPARDAIKQANTIFLSPGSLHGSILCNFLPYGMKEAIADSHAKIFLITNLVSSRNETHNFSPQDYVEITERYMGKRPDGIIVPDISRNSFEAANPEVSMLYASENSHFLGWEDQELYRTQSEGVEVIAHRATNIVSVSKEKQIVRHDPALLAEALSPLI